MAGISRLLLGAPWRRRVVVGVAAGVAQYSIGLWWVNEFTVPGLVLLVLMGAAFTAGAAALVRARSAATVALSMPAAWTLTGWVRDHYPLGGIPIGGLSLGQASSPLAPVVRLAGSPGLTAVTVALGVAVGLLGVALGLLGVAVPRPERNPRNPRNPRKPRDPRNPRNPRKPRDPRNPRSALAGAAILVVVAGAVLTARLSPGPTGTEPPRSIRVALVQGGGPRGTRAVTTNPQVVFQRHLAASAALRPPLDLVVWPEGVLQSHAPFAQGADAAEVAALARATGATVVVGVEQDVPPRYLNEAVAWNPQGRIIGTYVKNHLVPFGEYVPFRSLLRHVANLADVPYDAIPGHGPGILDTPAGPLGVMLSYEVFYDGRARAALRAGAQVLIVPTNTASYRSTQVPTQELAADRLRALETGRWLLQVTPTGYTAVVSPAGAVVQRTQLDQRAVIGATVPLERGRTVFVRFGDAPLLIGALTALAIAWRRTARRRTARRRSTRPGWRPRRWPRRRAAGDTRPGRRIDRSGSSSSAPATNAARPWPPRWRRRT